LLSASPDAVVLKIAVSLSIGLLVGFERAWSNKDVGIRTFALISLLGIASSLVAMPLSVAAFFAIFVLIAIVNVRSILVDRSLEITTSAALLVTFALGVLVGMGHLLTPVGSAILMTMPLAWKAELQRFAGGGTVLATMASALINVPRVTRQSRDNKYASRLAGLTSV
jgi:uncharacterized membrane protein YhiD involved in acid resistance